jgi:hypothetical protein
LRAKSSGYIDVIRSSRNKSIVFILIFQIDAALLSTIAEITIAAFIPSILAQKSLNSCSEIPQKVCLTPGNLNAVSKSTYLPSKCDFGDNSFKI